MGKTREEAQLQAAENALRNLASKYPSRPTPKKNNLINNNKKRITKTSQRQEMNKEGTEAYFNSIVIWL